MPSVWSGTVYTQRSSRFYDSFSVLSTDYVPRWNVLRCRPLLRTALVVVQRLRQLSRNRYCFVGRVWTDFVEKIRVLKFGLERTLCSHINDGMREKLLLRLYIVFHIIHTTFNTNLDSLKDHCICMYLLYLSLQPVSRFIRETVFRIRVIRYSTNIFWLTLGPL